MRAAIRIGPAGWAYEDWRGIVYEPKSLSRIDPLPFLAEYFDTIEINSTFYRPISPQTAKKWCRKVSNNSNFKFTAKLWRIFTHADIVAPDAPDPMLPGDADTQNFKDCLAAIYDEGRLGCVVAQFPWSFKNTAENRAKLEKIINAFGEFPLAIEVRHSSWDTPRLYNFLSDRGVNFVNIDQPATSRSIRPTSILTSNLGYVRLHGRRYDKWFDREAGRNERYDYLYTMEELKEWAVRIQDMAGKAKEVYVIANNHFKGQAVCNAHQLQFLLSGEKINVPERLKRTYPQLEEISR